VRQLVIKVLNVEIVIMPASFAQSTEIYFDERILEKVEIFVSNLVKMQLQRRIGFDSFYTLVKCDVFIRH